jgi:penicillin amidase
MIRFDHTLSRLLLLTIPLGLLLTSCSDDPEPDGQLDASTDAADDTASDTDVGGEEVAADTTTGDADTNGDAEPDAVEFTPEGIMGLSAPTTVYIDDMGVPHIECANNADCAAAMGYLHASDRFAQMDIRRRVTTGRLHQLVGELAVDVDASNRALYSTPQGLPAEDALTANISDDSMELLVAYSAGVNAWLSDLRAGRNGVVLQDEYSFPLVNIDVIPDWRPADSLATVLALINQLTNDSDRELSLAEAYASVSPEMAADLYGPTPGTDSVIFSGYEFPKSNSTPQRQVGAEAVARIRHARGAIAAARESVIAANVLRPYEEEPTRGSNNWVISPAQAAGDEALLSNDPHLGLSNPSVWYYAHMDSKTNGDGDYNVAGQSFAGMPWIVIGQNEDIAWGATNTFFDMSDVVIETLSEDGSGVMFEGEVVPFIEVEYAMDPSDADPTTRTLRFVPHHGPVLSIDEEAGTAISLVWTGNRVTTDGNFLTELMRSSTVDEARETLTAATSIGQNWVVIDTEGSIGWFPYNQVPTRPWASMDTPSFLPIPGDGTAEWGDPVPYEDLPQLYNPAEGYIATANNDMNGALQDGDPFNDGSTPLQVYATVGYRHARIVEMLEADLGRHDPDSMLAAVADVYSLIGKELTPVLLDAIDDFGLTNEFSDAELAVIAALDGWGDRASNFSCPTGMDGIDAETATPTADADAAAASIGCTAFHVLWGQVRLATFADEVNEGVRFASPQTMVRLLLRPDGLNLGASYWDDVTTEGEETRADTVGTALSATAEWLVDELGETSDGWRWGIIHTLTLRAELFDSFGIGSFNSGPWVNDGGLYTVDVASPRNTLSGNFSHSSGASTRFVCRAPVGGTVSCQVQLPGGQRHFRDSDNYEDLLMDWLVNEPSDLLFDITAAAESAASTIVFTAPAEE